MLRAHVRTGGAAAVVAPGTGTAHRVVEQLTESETPPRCWTRVTSPSRAWSACCSGPLHDGV